MSESSIAKVLPAEYAAYEQALTGDGGLNDARAAIALLAKAKEMLEGSLSSNNPGSAGGFAEASQEQDSVSAYCAAWCLCIRTMQNSTDQTARPIDCAQGRQLIMDEWNKSLQEDSDLTPLQIYALGEQWGWELLTNDFWQLLNQTDNRQTVFAICYVLYEHGNADDICQLMQNANPALMWDFKKSYRTQLMG